MNRVELEAAEEAAAARINAAVPEVMRLASRSKTVAVFAGTGLPGHDVLRMLADLAGQHAWRVEAEGMPAERLGQGIALNAFLLGFECGKRS